MSKHHSKAAKLRARILVLINRGLSLCSIRFLFYLSRVLAHVVVNTSNQLSMQSLENIQLCFPELDSKKQKQLQFDNIHHTCCNFFELAAIWHKPLEQVLASIESVEAPDEFFTANQARLIIAPHHGSWELLTLWLASHVDLYALYKPARNPDTDQYIYQGRTRNGATLVPIDTSGLRKLLKALKNQSSCMVLPDQKPKANKSGTLSKFCKHPVDTSLLVKNLASKINCQVYMAAAIRDTTKGCYHIRICSLEREPLIADDETSAHYLNQQIEQFITVRPAQYQWTYRRFPEAVYAAMNHSS